MHGVAAAGAEAVPHCDLCLPPHRATSRAMSKDLRGREGRIRVLLLVSNVVDTPCGEAVTF